MSYDLHVRRTEDPIALEEWKAYIRSEEAEWKWVTRLEGTNPMTGKKFGIRIPKDEPTAFWVRNPDVPFRWRDGELTVPARAVDPVDKKDPARIKLLAVAKHFSASVYADDGELIFDLESAPKKRAAPKKKTAPKKKAAANAKRKR